ncbi:uncharacterized protein PG998_014546 [Apiospora kogelbergensis]|uniref:uncharacterized protein n=1 Tax=Apiospora kogelbergensis TaxID=1337665 RepID=UPI003131CB8E
MASCSWPAPLTPSPFDDVAGYALPNPLVVVSLLLYYVDAVPATAWPPRSPRLALVAAGCSGWPPRPLDVVGAWSLRYSQHYVPVNRWYCSPRLLPLPPADAAALGAAVDVYTSPPQPLLRAAHAPPPFVPALPTRLSFAPPARVASAPRAASSTPPGSPGFRRHAAP